MKSALLVFSFLFVALNAAVVNRNLPQILDTPTDTPPCSTNASSAYVDIILVIDTSVNMGTSNLRKISTTLSLVLPKFTIGQQVNLTQGFRNTRIAVVTYDTQATIAANYTDINSVNDLTKLLNGLSASNSQEANLYDGITKAYYLQTNCSDINTCQGSYAFRRPAAMIIFAASANSKSVSLVPGLVAEADFFDDGTVITVNFNTADQDLTNLLKNITWVHYIKAQMYNFSSTSNTLTRDLEWAILQANCYCGDVSGINTIYYDQANNRYSRYAECMFLDTYAGQQYPNDTIDMCAWSSLQVIPAFVLTKQRAIFVQNVWMSTNPFTGNLDYPFYFGLHQNNQSQWSFYNYDQTEFPVSSYTNWGKSYPNGTDRCAILDSTDGKSLVWKNYDCNTAASGLGMILCQGKACDASSLVCCEACISESISYDKKQKIRTKNRHIRHMKMVNGKAVRIG